MVPLFRLLQLVLLLNLLLDEARGSAGTGAHLAFAPPASAWVRPLATTSGFHLLPISTSYSLSFRASPGQEVAIQRPRRPPTSSDRHRRAGIVTLRASKRGASEPGPEQPPYKPPDDGRSVGFVLLGLSLLASAWLFTIPPSFRRAYLCPSDYFVVDQGRPGAQPNEPDCVPWDAWWSNVFDYYRNGGGIQWDFSIDPQTLRDNREFLDAVVASYSKHDGGASE